MKSFPGGYRSSGGVVPHGRSFTRSVRYAARGMRVAWQLEPNLTRQLFAALLVIILAFSLHLSTLRIAVLVICCAAVLVLELLNSALEAVADAVHPHYHDKIRDAKDMLAGAVLVMSLAAVFVGLLLLGPPLWFTVVQ